jgi:hypothetical protein
MIVKLTPHPDQIRHWVQDALNAFETLDHETAAEIAKSDMRSILAYLDRTEDAVTVLGIVPVETRIRDELGICDTDRPNAPHLEIVRP